MERADSWSTDGHKWLNTPYDCGIAITADPDAHERAMNIHAAYIPDGEPARDSIAYTPEMSRRGRGVTVWAALRQLGREGVADLVDRLRARTREFAELLGDVPGCEILHDVVLNQLSVRFADPAGQDDAAHMRWLVQAVHDEGTCYPTISEWHGSPVMRISVSNHRTTSEDVHRSVAVIATLHAGGRS
jgi:glutamate/tyrosine decarboxylase-like PLP-dependent enzyme